MTTHTPRAPYNPEELATLYPSQLELQQVQVILRHGERTPVNARFKNVRFFHPFFFPQWKCRLTA
jgi:acid phosphatase